MLEALKRTIARVELDGKPNGTAFLVDRKHVATALHVLGRRSTVDLVFVEWHGGDRKRVATRTWRHPAYDIAILELDRECPSDIQPLPWATTPGPGDRWSTFGFPAQVPDGQPLVDERINDPSLLIEELELRVLHLHTLEAQYDLGGFSGAPCVVGGAIVGVIAYQLRRTPPGGAEQTVREPSLHTLYALPIPLFAASGIVPLLAEQGKAPGELVRLAEAFASEAKASMLAAMLRAIDRVSDQSREVGTQRAAIARRLGDAFRIVVQVVWRRENERAGTLAHAIYLRFTRSAVAQTSPGLRIPTFLHDQPTFLGPAGGGLIDRARIEHTLIVVLRDDRMVIDDDWRACCHRIAELADADAAGTSIIPVDLGGERPRRAVPFEARRAIHLPADAPASRLVSAVEERLLHVLARRRAEPRPREHVRLFLSYASADGKSQADAIRRLADATPGVDALMDDTGLAPGESFQKLEDMIEGRVLIAFVTPLYVSRAWCRLEFLTAKRLGAPVVVVDSQEPDLARAFPYLGNVPWVKWRDDPSRHYDIIEAAAFEVLRDQYVRLQLEDQTLLDERLKHAHIVTRPPELLDVVEGGPLAQIAEPVVLHPDPPIPDEELMVLRRVHAMARVTFMSPGQAIADVLRRSDGEPLPIALSASPADVMAPGVSGLHFEDAWLDLIRMLLLGGAILAFGGDLRPGGLTNLLLEVAEQRSTIEQRKRHRRQAPVRSYLAWPSYLALTDEREADLFDRVAFRRIDPPASAIATFPPVSVPPTSPEGRYLWSLSMTRMRCTILDDVAAMVVIGGKSTGYAGRYAGVVEEILLAVERGTPVFLLGGFGGAAAAVGEALLGKPAELLSAPHQLRAPADRAFADHYNDAIQRDDGADDRAPIDHDAVVAMLRERGVAGLRNGLSDDANRLLLASPSMHEISPILMRGLRGLLASGNAPASSTRRSARNDAG